MEPHGRVVRLYAVGSVPGESIAAPDRRPSFDDLYGSQWQRLVRFAALTTGSVALGEEIVQDAFFDLHRRWSHVEHPVAYLRSAVCSRCTSWVRRQRLERRVGTEPSLTAQDESLIELLDALKILTDRQRAAVVLRYVEMLSEADIALALSCRPGTVKSLLARAHARLKKELKPE
jgi:RNA polymerase sigma factor (sigma-70 family)